MEWFINRNPSAFSAQTLFSLIINPWYGANGIKCHICVHFQTKMVQYKYNYKDIEYVGEGTQATVFRATSVLTNKQVAIKVYAPNKFECFRELGILKHIQRLKLRNSIQFVETLLDNGHMLLISEYFLGIELHDFLVDGKIQSYEQLKSICKKILLAVHELHENNICHLDLKLENIMINEQTEEIKLIDFGFAEITKDEPNNEEKILNKYRGSIHYSAPEIITNIPYDGKKADIWSLGVLFYALYTQQLPFSGSNRIVAQKVMKNELLFPSNFHPLLQQVIEVMMKTDPTKRPPTKILLQHPFFL